MQTVSVLELHACATYLPGGHNEQSRQTLSAKYGQVSFEYVPAGHTLRVWHTVGVVPVQVCA